MQYLRKELEAKKRGRHILQVVLDFHLRSKLVSWHYKNAISGTFNINDTELVTEVPTSSISTKHGWKKQNKMEHPTTVLLLYVKMVVIMIWRRDLQHHSWSLWSFIEVRFWQGSWKTRFTLRVLMFQAITVPSKLLEYASLLAQIKEIKKYSVHSWSEKSALTEECKITSTVNQINVHFLMIFKIILYKLCIN